MGLPLGFGLNASSPLDPYNRIHCFGVCRGIASRRANVLLPVPALVVIFSLYQWRCLNNPDSHSRPFILTLGLVFLGFSGLGISIWPHIIPPSITLWQAAAPTQSQGFMLVGAL